MPVEAPLEGVTVFELGHSVAAPYAGMILADLGARVVKVENPSGGDYARGWGPPFWEGDASVFHALNRGKDSVTIDFSDEDSRNFLRDRILGEADAVIQNLRPGGLARYWLDADTLTAIKPGLIYCDIGAFGPGPLGEKPGYDPLMQAFSGVMSVTGEGGDRPPVRVGVSIMDMGSGMWAVIGLLSSLLARAQGRAFGNVATSLYETGLAWMTVHLAGYAASGEVRRPYGSGLAEIVPYQAFETADGWLMIAAGNDGLFVKLCAAIDRPDLSADPALKSNPARVAHRERLLTELSRTFRPMRIADLCQALDAAGVPNAPIQSVDEVMAHPHTQALGMIAPAEGSTLPLAGTPLSLGKTRVRSRRPAPTLGRHNDAKEPARVGTHR